MLGILTLAQGEKRYIDMAKMLALSLIGTNPGIKRAVISDAPEDEFKGFYDIYIPYNPDFGPGLNQKLFLDKYSPFSETIFIDSDCLVFNKLDTMIELCQEHPFVVFGDQISSGEWYMDVAEMCKKFNLPSIPLFNGGTYYFKNTDVTFNIYDQARQLKERYDELGFIKFRGSINEEPLIAVSMAINNIEAVDDAGIGMRTPIGIIGSLKIDVLNSVCAFNKEEVFVEPAILHFPGSYASAFHYKREVRKLKLAHKISFLNKRSASFIVNLTSNTPYAMLVFCKRVLKVMIRGEKFEFKNRLPVFSNL
ncbi:MAG: hypothetical protein ACXVB0_02075 [Mucilaginibacter sp.]